MLRCKRISLYTIFRLTQSIFYINTIYLYDNISTSIKKEINYGIIRIKRVLAVADTASKVKYGNQIWRDKILFIASDEWARSLWRDVRKKNHCGNGQQGNQIDLQKTQGAGMNDAELKDKVAFINAEMLKKQQAINKERHNALMEAYSERGRSIISELALAAGDFVDYCNDRFVIERIILASANAFTGYSCATLHLLRVKKDLSATKKVERTTADPFNVKKIEVKK